MSNTLLLYGIHPVAALLSANPQRIKTIFLENSELNRRQQDILEKAEELHIPVQRISRSALEKKIDAVHQGVIAEYLPAQVQSENELFDKLQQLTRPVQLLILDEIQDPHNLGACLRSAEVFAVDGVIAPKNNSVGLTETVRKVACGAAEAIDYYQVTNLSRSIQQIKSLGVWIVGAVMDAPQTIAEINWSVSSALIMGNEHKGIRPLTLKQCDYLATIPMYGTVSSLNVSVATGIILYECQRQRSGK